MRNLTDLNKLNSVHGLISAEACFSSGPLCATEFYSLWRSLRGFSGHKTVHF